MAQAIEIQVSKIMGKILLEVQGK